MQEMIQGRTVETGMEIPNRRGAGERSFAEGESAGPDAIWQVSQGIEGYPAMGGQLAAGYRDHAARPYAQEVIPARMERRFLSPWQDTQRRESRDDTLATEHLGVKELVGHLQEIGDILGLRGYSGRVAIVLLFGGTEEDPVLTRHCVEVLSILQRDCDGRPPLFVRPEDDVYSLAQSGDWIASGVLHHPQEIQPRTCGVNHGPAPDVDLSLWPPQGHAGDPARRQIQIHSPQVVRNPRATARCGGFGGERPSALVCPGLVVDGVSGGFPGAEGRHEKGSLLRGYE